jgi:putative oxidoreductase
MPSLLASSSLPYRAYRQLVVSASYLQSPVLLLIRLYWGWQLWVSGTGHLRNVDAMAERFTSWGIPFPVLNVYLSGATEAVCGVLLFIGLASRLVAIPLIGNFVVAYLTASRETVLNIFNDHDAFVTDSAFLYLYASVLVLAFGPGLFSVDGLLARTVFKKGRGAAGS